MMTKHVKTTNKFISILAALCILLTSVPASLARTRYVPLDLKAGSQAEDIELQINTKSLHLDLSKTQNLRFRIRLTDLYRNISRTSSIRFNLYEVIGSERVFISTQNLTVFRGQRKSRIISIGAGHFDSPTKNIEIEVFDTEVNLVNTYVAQIEASGLGSQVQGGDGVNVLAADCDSDNFDDCQLDYLFQRVSFEAKPQRQISTRVVKGEDGVYKVTLPVPRTRFKFLGRRVRRSGNGNDGDGGEAGFGFGETITVGTVELGPIATDTAAISFDGPDDLITFGPTVTDQQVVIDTVNGRMGIGVVPPQASLDIAAGNGDFPQVVLNPGTLSSNLVNGALEFDGTDIYITKNGNREPLGTGATGPQGPQGPAGPAGATGPQGPAGTFTGGAITDSTLNGTTTINGTLAFNPNSFIQGNATVNGILFADQFNGGTFYGDGSNLTGISASGLGGQEAGNFLRSNTSDTFNGTELDLEAHTTLDINGDLEIADSTIVLDSPSGTTFQQSSGAITLEPATGSDLAITLQGNADLAVNNNVLFVETSNGNVGIGTNNPSQALEVLGTVQATAFSGDGTNITNIQDSLALGGEEAGNYLRSNTSDTFNGTELDLEAHTTLDINGDLEIADDIIEFDAATTTFNGAGLLTLATAAGEDIAVTLKDDGNLLVDGTTLTVNGTTGNVGIGTLNPTEELEVAGDIRATAFHGDGSNLTGVTASDLGGEEAGNYLRSNSSDTFNGAELDLEAHTTLDINGDLEIADDIIEFDAATTTFNGAGLLTLATAAGEDIAVTLKDDGNLLVDGTTLTVNGTTGNIGIGTLNPTEELEVAGDIRATAFHGDGSNLTGVTASDLGGEEAGNYLRSNSSDTFNGTELDLEAHTTLDINGDLEIADDIIEFDAATTTFNGAGLLTLATAPGEDIAVTLKDDGNLLVDGTTLTVNGTTGNVGIGTLNPTEELEVAGDIRATAFHGDGSNLTGITASDLGGEEAGNYLRSNSSDTFNGTELDLEAHTTLDINGDLEIADDIIEFDAATTTFNGAGLLTLATAAGEDIAVTLKNDGNLLVDGTTLTVNGTTGNVGIGTLNPTEELEVTGDIRATAFHGDGSNLTGITASDLGGEEAGNYLRSNTSDTFNGTELDLEAHTTLDINGDLEIADDIIEFDSATTTFNGAGLLTLTTAAGEDIAVTLKDDGNLLVDGTTLTVNGTTGNVGIGTLNPTEELEVAGDIRATAFHGDGSNLTGITASDLGGEEAGNYLRSNTSDTFNGTELDLEAHTTLDINGDLEIADDIIEFDAATTTFNGAGLLTLMTADGESVAIELKSGGNFQVATNSLVVNGDTNNIGIGTLNPNERLTVAGSISLDNLSSAPSANEGFGKVFVNGNELFFIDNGGTQTNISSAGAGASAINDLTDAKAGTAATNPLYLGTGAGNSDTSSSSTNNIGIGFNALSTSDADDINNIAIGRNTLTNNQSDNNVAIGNLSQQNTSTGKENTSLGFRALASNNTGSNNTALGHRAGHQSQSGDRNTYVGAYAGSGNINFNGDYNAFFGYGAGSGLITPGSNGNVAVGYSAGSNLFSGKNNIFLGFQAGDVVTGGNGNILIGADVNGSVIGSIFNEINIGNTYFGHTVNGNAGIGIFALDDRLTVNGVIAMDNLNSAPSLTEGFGKIFVNGDELFYIDNGGNITGLSNNVAGGNAGTLDGLDSSSFLRSDSSDTFNGTELDLEAHTTLDINGDLEIADDIIEFDAATTTFNGAGLLTLATAPGEDIAVTLKDDGNLLVDGTTLTVNGTTGNVGIGTLNPTEELEVAGDIRATAFHGDGSNLTGITASDLGGQEAANYLRSNTADTYNGSELDFLSLSTIDINGDLEIADESIEFDNPTKTILNGSKLFTIQTNANEDIAINLKENGHLLIDGNTLRVNGDTGYVGINTNLAQVGLHLGGGVPSESATVNSNIDAYIAGDLEVDGNVYATFHGDGSNISNVTASDLGGQEAANYLRSNTSDTFNGTELDLEAHTTLDINGDLEIADDIIEFDAATTTFNGAGLLTLATAAGEDIAITLKDDGNLLVDGTTLTINGTTGNVGIGTLNPTEELEVAGDIRATAFHGDGSNLSGITASDLGGQEAANYLRSNTSDTFNGTELDLEAHTTLDINGDLEIADNIIEFNSLTGTTFNGSSNLTITTSLDNDIAIDLKENGHLLVDSNKLTVNGDTGLVGIATNNPTETLDINGTIRIRGGSPGTGKFLKSVDATGTAVWDTVAGGGSADNIFFASDTDIVSNTGSNGDAANQSFVFGSDKLDSDGVDTERFFFDKASFAFRAGNAMAGQWNGSNLGNGSFATGLDTIANGDFSIAFGEGSISSAAHAISAGNGALAAGIGSLAIGNGATATQDNSIALGKEAFASGMDAIAIGSDNLSTAGGSIALGKSNSVSATQGAAIGSNNTISEVNGLTLGNNLEVSATGAAVLGLGNSSSDKLENTTNKSLIIGFNSNAATLFVGSAAGADTKGSVGIGTTSPVSALQVIGTITATNFSGSGGGLSGVSSSTLQGLVNGDFIRSNSSDTFNGTELDLEAHTTLDINGDLEIADGTILLDNGLNTTFRQTSGSITIEPAATENLIINLTQNADMAVNTNQLFVEGSNGNIGIGTVNPQETLEVAGTILAQFFNGDGSQLDGITADTLDLLDSEQFLRSDLSDNFNGLELDFAAGSTVDINGNLEIADDVITFDASSTTFQQTTGAISIEPASANNLNINLTGNGDFAVNSNNLFVETSNGNVGIGTNTPQATLQVVGLVSATSLSGDGSSVVNVNASQLQSLVNGDFLRSNSSDTYNGNELDFEAHTTLDLNGDLEIADGTILLDNGSNTTFKQTSGSITIEPAATGNLIVTLTQNADMAVNNDIFFIESSNGNVGIGTVNPQEKLEVAGTVLAQFFNGDGSQLDGVTADTLDMLDSEQFLRSDLSDNFNGLELDFATGSTVDINGNLEIADDVITLDAGSTTFQQTQGAITITPASGSNLNLTTSGNGDIVLNTNQLFLEGSNGNVGIGDLSPQAKLVVGDDSNITEDLSTNGAYIEGNLEVDGTVFAATFNGSDFFGSFNGSFAGDGSNITGVTASNATNSTQLGGQESANYLRSNTSDTFNGTELDLESHTTLDINGDLEIADDIIEFDAATTTFNGAGLLTLTTATGEDIAVTLKDDGNLLIDGTRLTVNGTSGNVGIGTLNPTEELEVAGDIRATAFHGDGSNLSGISASSLGGQEAANYLRSNTSDTFNGTELSIDASSLLDIDGDLEVTDDVIEFDGASTTFNGTGALSITTAANNDISIDLKENGHLLVDSNKLTINGDTGLIGINTTNPTETLDINGTIRIRGGSPGVGKFLKSVDATGQAVWDTVAGAGDADNIFFASGSDIVSNTGSNGDAANQSFVFGSNLLDSDGVDTERFFFDKTSYAFRAGNATASQWNGANLGTGSFATGLNTIANGDYSQAMGEGSIASEKYALAIGNGALASGNSSTAIGNGSLASKANAIAMGLDAIASGNGAVSLGDSNTVTGNNSSAFGTGNSVSGDNSSSLGSNNIASQDDTLALGTNTEASAFSAAVIGSGNSIADKLENNKAKSLAIGFNSNSATLFIGSSLGGETTGKVGIGTDSPSVGLHIGTGTPATITGNGSLFVSGDLEVSGALHGDGSNLSSLPSGVLSINDLTDASSNSVDNVFIGNGSGSQGSRNVALGVNALSSVLSTGQRNIAIGYNGLTMITTGDDNIAIGPGVLSTATNAQDNIGLGRSALFDVTSGDGNIAIGEFALNDVSGTDDNIAIGRNAGRQINTSGANNIAIGEDSMRFALHGANNIAVGQESLKNITNGDYNVAIGFQAQFNTGEGINNVAIGRQAAEVNSSGNGNTAIGTNALNKNTNSSDNTAIGHEALYSALKGNNTATGFRAGYNTSNGEYNTMLGYYAGENIANGSYNIMIGFDVNGEEAASSDYDLNIGDTIFGDLANGKVAIKQATFNPDATLEIGDGNLNVDADGTNGLLVEGDIDSDGTIFAPTFNGNNFFGTFNGDFYGDGSNLTGVTTNAAGSNEQVQFNDGGTSFGGDPEFTYDKINDLLSVYGTINGQKLEIGSINVISGTHSTAIGQNNNVSGNNSLAAGNDNIVSGGFALGATNNLTGGNSVALGSLNSVNGNQAVALGRNNHVVQQRSIAGGASNLVNGEYATAFGFLHTVNGERAFAAGKGSLITNGSTSIAMGRDNIIDGSFSAAIGRDNITSSNFNYAIGNQAKTSGERAVAIGAFTNADGAYSLSLGYSLDSNTEGAFTIGSGESASDRLTNNIRESLAIGFNSNTATLFVGSGSGGTNTGKVGIGTSSPEVGLHIGTGSPATVTGNGSLFVSGDLEVAGSLHGDGSNLSGVNTGLDVFSVDTDVISNNGDDADYADNFIIGSPSLDDDSNTSHDRRLFFHKAKSAFRAGITQSTQWDNSNLGTESAAFGRDTTARGNRAFATGVDTRALAQDSFAIGDTTTANGAQAFAAGEDTDARGTNSFAIGKTSKALKQGSFSHGNLSTANGDYSAAFNRSFTKGNYSFAAGDNSTTNGTSAIALGNRASANRDNSVAIGNFVESNGELAISIGSGNSSSDKLINNLNNSLSIGFNSNTTTLFVGSSSGGETTGKIGIGTTSPEVGLHIGTGSPSETTLVTDNGDLYVTGDMEVDGTAFATTFNGSDFFGSFNGTFAGDGSNLTGVSTNAAGSDTQVQFNDGGSNFGADAQFTYDSTNDILAVDGTINGSKLEIGDNNTITGTHSVAFGKGNTSSGLRSFTVGNGNIASGNHSITMGNGNTAQNANTVAIGSGNNVFNGHALGLNNTVAQGYALGGSNHVDAGNAVAIGFRNFVNGNQAIALGRENNAIRQRSLAAGFQNTTNGDYSIALGRSNVSNGLYALTAGLSNFIANGTTSIALGDDNNVTEGHSVAIGSDNNINSSYSFGLGTQVNTSETKAFGIGSDIDLNGAFTFAAGHLIDVTNGSSFAIGLGNSGTDTLTNNIRESLTIGFNSNSATLFVGTSTGGETTGKVGIGTTSPEVGLHIGTGSPSETSLVTDNGDLYVTGDMEVDGTAFAATFNGSHAGDGTNLYNISADSLGGTSASGYLRSDANDSFTATTLTISGASTLDIAGGLEIADTNILLDGASTTFTQSSGGIKLVPNSSASLEVNGNTALTPSNTASITAAGGITVSKGIMRINGSTASVDITANPQISDGTTDGQIVVIKGDGGNTVKLEDGTGLNLSSGLSFTVGNGDTMVLMYDANDDEWIEISRSDK